MTAIKERPIVFRDWEVRATREGRKTQKRIPIKNPDWYACLTGDCPHERQADCSKAMAEACPLGRIGGRLYVKESWLPDAIRDGTWPDVMFYGGDGPLSWIPKRFRKPKHCLYRSTWTGQDLRWRPPVSMPRWASRLVIEITDVRAEQLQAIREADAIAEGMTARLLGESVADLAAKIDPEPPRWLHGIDDNAHTYCHKCGVKRVKAASKANPGREIILDGGWIGEEDYQPFCETCGVPLDFSLTDYGVDEMLLAYGHEMSPITRPSDAQAIHAMLCWHGVPILTETCGDSAYKPEAAGLVARICFRHLWDAAHGKRPGLAWHDNPWVWAIEYREVRT